MLKFQEQNETVDAQTVRVNPQEFVEVLRTVEERKEAEARAQEGTIPIGQAIEALGLTYTPEEVLEALKAHRTRQEHATASQTVGSHKRRFIGIVAVAIILLSAVVSLGLRHSTPTAIVASPVAARNVTVGFQTKPLSQIGVGGTFSCDTNTLLRLAKGTAGSNTIVQVAGNHNDLWTATRASDGIKVQGVMTTADALNLANGQEATLYRSSEMFSTSSSTAVQVPLQRLTHIIPSHYDKDYISLKTDSE